MKCAACDDILTDFESSIRSSRTGQFIDLCTRCLSPIRMVLDTTENFLLYNQEVDDLDTTFERVGEMAVDELIEDDQLTGVTSDGERLSDGETRREDNL